MNVNLFRIHSLYDWQAIIGIGGPWRCVEPFSSQRPRRSLLLPARRLAPKRPQGSRPNRQPKFRSSVDLVSVAAVVRDRQGPVRVRLSHARTSSSSRAGSRGRSSDSRPRRNGPVKLAVLFDISGSMRVGIEGGRRAAGGAALVQRAEAPAIKRRCSRSTRGSTRCTTSRRTSRRSSRALSTSRSALRTDVAL